MFGNLITSVRQSQPMLDLFGDWLKTDSCLGLCLTFHFSFLFSFFQIVFRSGEIPTVPSELSVWGEGRGSWKIFILSVGGGILLDLPLISLFLLLQILLLLSIFSSSSCYSPRPSLLLLLLSLPSFTWNRSRSSVLRSRRLPILPVHLPGKGNNQHGQWGSFVLIYIQERNKTQPCILLQLQNFHAW